MKYLLSILALTLFISCKKEVKNSQTVDFKTQNDTEIQTYLKKNNLSAQKTASGLYYIINEEGSGNNPHGSSNVTVAYKGYFIDGKVFDESKPTGISFGLDQVVKGWTEGIPIFKEGGKGVLLIPSHLGYGSSGRSSIPGGATLIFDIHLISVN